MGDWSSKAEEVANNATRVLVLAYIELTQKNQIYVGLTPTLGLVSRVGALGFMEEHF